MYVIKTSYNGKQIYQVCPSCGKNFNCYPAISRKDNKTEICPECGEKTMKKTGYLLSVMMIVCLCALVPAFKCEAHTECTGQTKGFLDCKREKEEAAVRTMENESP